MTKTRLLIGTAMMLVTATPALAQLRATDYTNSVLVDMSQIDALTPQRLSLGGNPGGLLPPPTSAPTSHLLGSSGASRAAAPRSAPVSHLTRPSAPAKPVAKSAPKATASAAPTPKASSSKTPTKSTAKAVATPAQEAAQAARTESAVRTPAPSVAGPTPLPGMALVGPEGPNPAAKGGQQTAAVAPQARVESPAAPPPTPPAVELPKAPEAPAAPVASAPPAAPPAPAVAAPPPARPAPQQQAAVQPRAPAAPESSEVRFTAGDANLSDDGKGRLDRIADAMKANGQSRLQLLAYAVEDGSPSKSRRLSLSRALAVRSYLINKGVQSARIDVRALGDSVPSGDPNRVDLKILDR